MFGGIASSEKVSNRITSHEITPPGIALHRMASHGIIILGYVYRQGHQQLSSNFDSFAGRDTEESALGLETTTFQLGPTSDNPTQFRLVQRVFNAHTYTFHTAQRVLSKVQQEQTGRSGLCLSEDIYGQILIVALVWIGHSGPYTRTGREISHHHEV